MEKLKLQLAPVAKHWFWIATVLVMLGSVGVWWMASGKLIAEYDTASSKIKTDDGRVKTVSAKLNEHPNPKTHAEMQKLIDGSKQSVLDAWTTVYESQQGILVWPEEQLKEDFVREFRDLTPIELKFPTYPVPEEQEKETSLLNRYRYYIGEVLPEIAELAGSKWTASFDKAAGAGAAMGSMGSYGEPSAMYPSTGDPALAEDGPLVRWDASSQEALMNDLFPWRGSGSPPKTLDVLYSQENLWILRQLMQIISTVNGDVAQRFQAKIHNINQVAIGASVKTTAGLISKPAAPAAMGGMDSSMAAEMTMDSSTMSGTEMGGAAVDVDPGDNRYVDTTGKPILASQLRSALSSNSPTDAFMAVAKRIPVMLSLKMDQRSIPDLLAACGSAPLMVEVKQVRILSSSGASMAPGAGMDAMSSPGSGSYGGSAMQPSPMGGPGMDMAGGTTTNEQFPMDLNVEIYGIIYIYNPPLPEKLGVEKVTEDTVVEGTSMRDGSKVETAATSAPADAPAAQVPASATAEPAGPVDPPANMLPATEALPAPAGVPVDPATQPAAPANALPADPGAVPPNPVTPGVPPLDPTGAAAPAPAPAIDPAATAPPANSGVYWRWKDKNALNSVGIV
jgi:hypothetical protein